MLRLIRVLSGKYKKTMIKDIKNSSYAGIELSELLSNYNNDRETSTILTGNSNEIRPLPSIEGGSASGGESPHKLYNNFSNSDSKKSKMGKYHRVSEKASQNASNAEIGAL